MFEMKWRSSLTKYDLYRGDMRLLVRQQQDRIVDQRPQLGVGVQKLGFLAEQCPVSAGDGGLG